MHLSQGMKLRSEQTEKVAQAENTQTQLEGGTVDVNVVLIPYEVPEMTVKLPLSAVLYIIHGSAI